MLVYRGICSQVKVQLELVKTQLELVRIFNTPSSLTDFEIQMYYQNEAKFNSGYSRNNLLKIKNGAFVIYLDEYELIGTRWIALYVNSNNIIYFDRFGVVYILQEIKKNS